MFDSNYYRVMESTRVSGAEELAFLEGLQIECASCDTELTVFPSAAAMTVCRCGDGYGLDEEQQTIFRIAASEGQRVWNKHGHELRN